MSEEEGKDYIVIKIDDDSDDTTSEEDAIIIEDSESDTIQDTTSDDVTADSHSQDGDNYQQQAVVGHGAACAVNQSNQAIPHVSRPINLRKRSCCSMDSSQRSKRRQICSTGGNLMRNYIIENSEAENLRNQFREVREFCQNLQDLLERISRQMNQVCEIISRLEQLMQLPQAQRSENRSESLNKETEEAQGQNNPEGAIPQPVPHVIPENPVPGLNIIACYCNSGAQNISNVIYPNQPAGAAAPVLLQPQGHLLINNPSGMAYPVLVGIEGMNTNAATSFVYVPPSFVMPGIDENCLRNHIAAMNDPTLAGNYRDHIAANPPEMPANPRNVVGNNPQILNEPIVVEDDSDEEPTSTSLFVVPDFAILNSEEGSPQAMNNNQESGGGQTVSSSVSLLRCLGRRPERPGTSNDSGASTGNDNEQDNSPPPSSSCSPGFGYLGAPQRNIKIRNAYLATARNKANPTYAASYLVNVLFSEEMLLFGSVKNRAPGCIPLDRNKMAAIREYLATVFPQYDLSERGKDWKSCLSTITTTINYLYAETEIPEERNPSMSVPENWHSGSSDHGDKAPSAWFQQIRASVRAENEDTEQNACANAEGTDDVANPEELVNLGYPSRNVLILHSILKIAKKQIRPEQAAKYLILYLYPEEVLIGSTVYGNLECGLFALDRNRIEALREFLQENYPEQDLHEDGYYWKMCVTAINSCLQSLRHGPQNSAAEP